MSETLKIAMIAPNVMPINNDLAYGGAELVIKDLAEEYVKMGHEVLLVAPKGTAIKGCEVFETVTADGTWGKELEAFEKYKKSGKFRRCNIIHSHEHNGLMLEYAQGPLVHTFHGVQTWPELKNPDAHYICLSEWHKEDCISKFGEQFNKEKETEPLHIIGHGIDLKKYRGVNKERTGPLSFGLVTPHKGHHMSIEACHKLQKDLVIAGEHNFISNIEYRNRIIVQAAQAGFPYLGPVDHQTKVDLLQLASCVLLPFQQAEAYSLILIEALACGTPAITTGLGAMPEMIEDDVTGKLCESVEEFEAAIEKFDHPTDPNIHKFCRQRAAKYYDRKLMAEKHIALYKEVLDE